MVCALNKTIVTSFPTKSLIGQSRVVVVQFWNPSPVMQRRGEKKFSPRGCVTGKGVQNWSRVVEVPLWMLVSVEIAS